MCWSCLVWSVMDVCAVAAALRKLLCAWAALHRVRASLLQWRMMASRQGAGRSTKEVFAAMLPRYVHLQQNTVG
jgi:hypothetical protein